MPGSTHQLKLDRAVGEVRRQKKRSDVEVMENLISRKHELTFLE
jgi:hypothetical protein